MFFTKRFDPLKDLPDLTGKVIIVTGGNTGIGYATVKHLARRGAKVYMGARSEAKATQAITNLKAEGLGPGYGEILWMHVDLGDPRKAKKAAEDFLSVESRLDVVVNNAGLMPISNYEKTCDGILDSMMINHISTFVFTQTLLPRLIEAAKRPDADIRIVNISSDAIFNVPEGVRFRNIDDFNCEFSKSFVPPMMQYSLSKLANILYSNELQRRLSEQNIPIIVLSVHPGVVNTLGDREIGINIPFKPLIRLLMPLVMKHPDQGAYTQVIAAASSEIREKAEIYRGAFLVPVGKISRACEDGKRYAAG